MLKKKIATHECKIHKFKTIENETISVSVSTYYKVNNKNQTSGYSFNVCINYFNIFRIK